LSLEYVTDTPRNVDNYQLALRNVPEECRNHLHRGRSQITLDGLLKTDNKVVALHLTNWEWYWVGVPSQRHVPTALALAWKPGTD
jgi:hypothetical protein